jgi:CheY-like chemotaxis protein
MTQNLVRPSHTTERDLLVARQRMEQQRKQEAQRNEERQKQAEAQQRKLDEQKKLNPMFPGRRVLIAEDQPVNAQIVRKLLEQRGVTVDWVRNGKLAVEQYAKSPADYYDLILMDIRMPVMTGTQATRQLRALDRLDAATVPIIALTADVTGRDASVYTAMGLDDLLAKPVFPAALDAMMEKWSPAPLRHFEHFNDSAAQRGAPSPVIYSRKPDFPGLDVSYALTLTDGDIGLYLSALHIYLDQIPERAKLIETCLQRENFRRCTIEVHSMKAAARQIGALEMSTTAAQLEEVCKAGDRDTLNAELPQLLETYRGQQEPLSAALEAYERQELPERFVPSSAPFMDEEQLCSELKYLQKMLASDRLDSAIRLNDDLQTWQQETPEGAALMDALAREFDEFDYDSVDAQIKLFFKHIRSDY